MWIHRFVKAIVGPFSTPFKSATTSYPFTFSCTCKPQFLKQPNIDGKPTQGYGASAFRLEDTEFRDAFKAELQKLKDSGELLKIIGPFGFTENELSGDITAAQLCKHNCKDLLRI